MAIVRLISAICLSGTLFLLGPNIKANMNYSGQKPFAVKHEFIVKLKRGVSPHILGQFSGVKTTRKVLKSSPLYFVITVSPQKFDKLSLQNHPSIDHIGPNYTYRVQGFKRAKSFHANELEALTTNADLNDPKWGVLWGLKNAGNNEPDADGNLSGTTTKRGADLKALSAWKLSGGDKSLKIAVIDTGVDYEHEDLAANMWVNPLEANGIEGVDDDGNGFVDDIHGYDFSNGDGDPLDRHGHGTHSAGVIAATHDNLTGVAGVMKEVSLVAIKFMDDDGSGTTEHAIQAIDYATRLGVSVMSNSWGGTGYSKALEEAIERAKDKGIVFVAAAGNQSNNNDFFPLYPASFKLENVISVAAHNARDELAYFSSFGRNSVHIMAPGYNIVSTVPGHKYAVYSGTSTATPHVAGALGLLLSSTPFMGHEGLKERLLYTSTPVENYLKKSQTSGRVNAFNLLTNFRPQRFVPMPGDWKKIVLNEQFESDHPYANNKEIVRKFQVNGAKYIRVIIDQYDLENNYDFIVLKDPKSGEEIEKITGSGESFVSDYVEGDQIEVKFLSDGTVARWGFRISEIEYVLNR